MFLFIEVFVRRTECQEARGPYQKTEVNKTAFSQPEVGKIFTTCRTGETVYTALVFLIVGSSTQNIQ